MVETEQPDNFSPSEVGDNSTLVNDATILLLIHHINNKLRTYDKIMIINYMVKEACG